MASKGSTAAEQGAGRRLCTGALACASVVSCAVFAYGAASLAMYTPLCRPLECIQQHSGLGALHMDAQWVNTSGAMKKRCSNPNNYPIRATELSVGKVYVLGENNTLTAIGVSHVPETIFPARGEVLANSEMEIAVPSSQASALLASPLLRVVSELKVRSEAELRFFGLPLRSGEDKVKVCGFELRLATKKVGPSACAATLEQLVIPDVDSAPEKELVEMNAEKLEAATTKKNWAFGMILALSGLLWLLTAALALRQLCAGRRQEREMGDALKVGDAAQARAEAAEQV